MKQFFISLALFAGVLTARLNAQENSVQESDTLKNVPEAAAPEKSPENVQNSPSTGDLYSGLTRPLTFNRMIAPYALEVTFYKTVHIIFPAGIRYVDLGSIDLLAAKADGAENVLRVKAATQGFGMESNLSVITEDGSYYTFNVKYSDEPVKLSVEMADFLHSGNAVNRPGNEIPVYLSDLGNESPYLVRLIMETVYRNNRKRIRHIGSQNFGVQYTLKGLYSHNDLLFFHLQLKNFSTVSFNIDYVVFKIVDKKVAKRTAIQEQVIVPLRAYNQMICIAGNSEERTVFTLPKFTVPKDKRLIIELTERDGGRNQTLTVENSDLVHADIIDDLTLKVK
jgi:conjugative transposon TraN protein